MAVIKKSSRRRHPATKPVSWPNNIPRDRRGSGHRTQQPAHDSKRTLSLHRTYPAKANSARRPIPGHEPPARAFRPLHRNGRPPARHLHRISANLTSRQKSNTKSQTLKAKRTKATGKPQLNPHPAQADSLTTCLETYNTAYEARLLAQRKWTNTIYAARRISFPIKKELNAYFGKRKFGERPSAHQLSRLARQAVELSEHDLGTELAWARTQTWVFGTRWAGVFGEMIDRRMERGGGAVGGPGWVGEEEVEGWACREEYWERKEGVEGLVDAVGELEVRRGGESEDEGGEFHGGRASRLRVDEAEGLGFLDELGNVPSVKDSPEIEEEVDFEIDLEL